MVINHLLTHLGVVGFGGAFPTYLMNVPFFLNSFGS
jgi:hypothetical protein